jgi:hypothetical protein
MENDRLWERYVLRRGTEVEPLWERLFASKPRRILYIAGIGFDTRAIHGPQLLTSLTKRLNIPATDINAWLVGFGDYALPEELEQLTTRNEAALRAVFNGANIDVKQIQSRDDDGILRTSYYADALLDTARPLNELTDIILDVSSLPRVVYLTMLVGLLGRLVRDKHMGPKNLGMTTNLHVLVAEDPLLDSIILSEEIDSDVKTIKGFSGGLGTEHGRGLPGVWFPLLGEGREDQLQKVRTSLREELDICPVVPHPTRDPRRGDNILIEYRERLFNDFGVEPANIVYVNEGNPFEVYRQMHSVMTMFSESLDELGGCRLLVTPLSSKLITIGAGLACFELHDSRPESKRLIGIPYAEPRRYSIKEGSVMQPDNAILTTLLLTGEAYA